MYRKMYHFYVYERTSELINIRNKSKNRYATQIERKEASIPFHVISFQIKISASDSHNSVATISAVEDPDNI